MLVYINGKIYDTSGCEVLDETDRPSHGYYNETTYYKAPDGEEFYVKTSKFSNICDMIGSDLTEDEPIDYFDSDGILDPETRWKINEIEEKIKDLEEDLEEKIKDLEEKIKDLEEYLKEEIKDLEKIKDLKEEIKDLKEEIKAMAEQAPDDINLEEELAKMEAEQGQTRQRELGM